MLKKFLLFIVAFNSFLFSQITTQTMDDNASSLLAMNTIAVTIGGDFVITGTFPASNTERVDQFVTRMFNQSRQAELSAARTPELIQVVIDKYSDYAKRGIKLVHQDGTSQIVDLEKFRLTADFKYNPYLKYDDVIIFPPYNKKTDFVEITGAVNKPVIFQYVEGDTFADALLFARGLNPAYEKVNHVEISRLSPDGKRETVIKITPDKLDFKLMRGDRIRVVADAALKRNFKVLVLGEVYEPGYVFITKDSTTIREVIRKVGGFKPSADLVNTKLVRGAFMAMSELDKEFYSEKKLPIKENMETPLEKLFDPKTNILQMQRMADIIPEDSVVFTADNVLRLSSAQGGIDFTKVLDDSSSDGNFIVKDGDVIVVPEITNLVYVYGQVMNPGYIKYKPGADYDYYIEKTGGLGNRAKSEIYLIKGKSNAWIDMTDSDSEYVIESGDFIWVPKDVPRNFDFYLQRTARIASIVAAVATVILIFK